MKELLLYEIDRLVREEAKATEKAITEEIENIQPQFDSETGEFTNFKAWSQNTAKLSSFTVTSVSGSRLGQEVPESVTGELSLSLKDLPQQLRVKFVEELKE